MNLSPEKNTGKMVIDRKQANFINPLINPEGRQDTLSNCRHILALIYELTGNDKPYGYELHLTHKSTTGLHYLCEILDAALAYEEQSGEVATEDIRAP